MRSRGFRWAPAFAGVTLALLTSCGFQLRGDPEVGIKKLYISSVGPSQVQADIKRLLATGPTRIVLTAPEAAGAPAHPVRRRARRSCPR